MEKLSYTFNRIKVVGALTAGVSAAACSSARQHRHGAPRAAFTCEWQSSASQCCFELLHSGQRSALATLNTATFEILPADVLD